MRKTTSIHLNGNETIQLNYLDAGIYIGKIRLGNAWMSLKVIVMK